ncbi:hypothetical protein [Streptomyces sp. NPDC088748]|uniref:hypothetical protein n=1 Tax=unclassified Streptomyces TaxID=2593676 RepID=UPI0009A55822
MPAVDEQRSIVAGKTAFLIARAIKEAAESQCRYRVGAVLANGNRIISAAANSRRNSPTVDFRHATFHAEEAALRRVRQAAGSVAYIARVGADGRPMMARPCSRCRRALYKAGIYKAFYTLNEEHVGFLEVTSDFESQFDPILPVWKSAENRMP